MRIAALAGAAFGHGAASGVLATDDAFARPLPTLQALWRQPSLLAALVVPAPGTTAPPSVESFNEALASSPKALPPGLAPALLEAVSALSAGSQDASREELAAARASRDSRDVDVAQVRVAVLEHVVLALVPHEPFQSILDSLLPESGQGLLNSSDGKGIHLEPDGFIRIPIPSEVRTSRGTFDNSHWLIN